MRELSKKLLNYYATFTETKFNFARRITYRWTDDEFTLDVGIYPEYARRLINAVSGDQQADINVSKHQYSIKIDSTEIKKHILDTIKREYDQDYLAACISDAAEKIKPTLEVSSDGAIEKSSETNSDEIKKQALIKGARTYNIAIRKKLEDTISVLHSSKVEELKQANNLDNLPGATFNQRAYTQQHYDSLQEVAKNTNDQEDFYKKVTQHFQDNTDEIVIYDLYSNLSDYLTYTGMGTLYTFVHAISDEKNSFPLYFMELEIRQNHTDQKIEISIPRDITLLNTPAINLFKFEHVLTIPRSSTRAQATSHIRQMQQFLSNLYKVHSPFIQNDSFKKIQGEDESMPIVSSRVGFQVIRNEDKKLLDYSEIHSRVDHGEESRFTNFISQYIEGGIESTQEEIDRSFKENYPTTSPKRYIHDNPLPLNTSQKRILSAIQNDKNKAIVVDGPPGTGKSHTIAAITYWANQNSKTLVITSHKKEALDVLERMLEKNFKNIHPHAKPSMLRLSNNSQTHNSISNTLASPVITAASDRLLDANITAVRNDLSEHVTQLEQSLKEKIEAQKSYDSYLKDMVRLDELTGQLAQEDEVKNHLKDYPKSEKALDFTGIDELIEQLLSSGIESLQHIKSLLPLRDYVPNILKAIEQLHGNSALDAATNNNNLDIPDEFVQLVSGLSAELTHDKPLKDLSPKTDMLGNTFQKLKKRGSIDQIQSQLDELQNIKYSSTLQAIADKAQVQKEAVTLAHLSQAVSEKMTEQSNSSAIESAQIAINNPVFANHTPDQIYAKLQSYQGFLQKVTPHHLSELEYFFEQYGDALAYFGIKDTALSSLSLYKNNEQLKEWIKLHNELSISSNKQQGHANVNDTSLQRLTQKLLEYQNDDRLKKLNNHVTEIAQIKQRYEKGRRFTEEQAKILLDNVSVIIAEPAMISKHFPMTEEMIDMLIVDEASQVSIADSISLMLRSKQAIVFGDEYQYGAVSAQNVSRKYSASYFREIINAYKDGYHANISEEAEQSLLAQLQKEQSDEEPVPEAPKKPDIDQGDIDWLRTFDIRTSTLSFTKAIANYSTSLKEHFRSYPEIIGYSNEFFYTPAQMELIVNRIRTQPITETLVFKQIDTKGKTGDRVNLDEIIFIAEDIQSRISNGFKGSIGIITSFREQQIRLEEYLQENTNYRQLKKDHDLAVWFVRDVQGEERDIVYYSFVEDKKLGNADLKTIYPVIGGTADNPRSIKMQQLNVGFSRAKNTMVFVHSMPLSDYSATRLGDALKHYQKQLTDAEENDHFVEDTTVFDSPMEEHVYKLLLQTDFYKKNKEHIHIVPQFEIGKYIKAEFRTQIPKYRADFLVTYSKDGAQKSVIIEYDGIEFHYKNPSDVTAHKLSQEFTEYDIARQLELESYGYTFIRLNKFNLRPGKQGKSEAQVLNGIIESALTA